MGFAHRQQYDRALDNSDFHFIDGNGACNSCDKAGMCYQSKRENLGANRNLRLALDRMVAHITPVERRRRILCGRASSIIKSPTVSAQVSRRFSSRSISPSTWRMRAKCSIETLGSPFSTPA